MSAYTASEITTRHRLSVKLCAVGSPALLTAVGSRIRESNEAATEPRLCSLSSPSDVCARACVPDCVYPVCVRACVVCHRMVDQKGFRLIFGNWGTGNSAIPPEISPKMTLSHPRISSRVLTVN